MIAQAHKNKEIFSFFYNNVQYISNHIFNNYSHSDLMSLSTSDEQQKNFLKELL